MALPFAQSMRSLQADRAVPTLIWLGIALVFSAAWGAWFFFAPITRYETGTIIGTTREGRLVAELPSYAYLSIQQGQPGYVRLQVHSDENMRPGMAMIQQESTITLPALVANILKPPENGHFVISLTLLPDTVLPPLGTEELVGEVTVEVEHVSPATLVAQASGQFIETPPLSFSPQ